MNQIQSIFKESLLIALAIFCQWLLVPLFAINGTSPDLLLLYLILRCLHLEKPGFAVITGFVSGFFFDWLTGGPIGLSSLTFTIAAFVSALAGREIEKLTKTHLLILGFTIIPFCIITNLTIRLYGLNSGEILITHILPSLTYNLIIYLIFIYFFSFKKKRKMI